MILSKFRGLIASIQFAITILLVIGLMYAFKKYNHKVRFFWAKLEMYLLGVKFEFEGELDSGADLLMINHQSLLDIVILESLHPRNIAWVAKKEIGNIPVFGHILKAPKMISVDRENKAGLIALLKDVKDRLDSGRPIAIFPEGTRSSGDELLSFKPGAKMIAEKYNLKIQPIVMLHTRTILDSKNLSANPGIVKIKYLPSFIPQKGTSWYEELETNMREIVFKEFNNVA